MIAIGTAVIISDKSKAYAGKYRGKEAVIERTHGSSTYGVRIEGMKTPAVLTVFSGFPLRKSISTT